MGQYSDRVKVLLGTFFDGTNEQIADLIVKTIPLDNVTFANMPEMEQLATLVKKYRPGDNKMLYEGLVSEYCMTGQVSILSLARVAAALGYDREQLVDDSIRTDLAMYAQPGGGPRSSRRNSSIS